MGWGLVPSFTSQRKSIGTGTAKIWKSINDIWSQLNVEVKHHDTTTFGTLSSTPTVYNLSDIGIGITGSSSNGLDLGYRDGDKIRVKTVNVKLALRTSVSTAEPCWVYLVKHYDNFSGTGIGAFNWDQIYSTPSGTINATRLRNHSYEKQYKILARRRVMLTGVEDKNNEVLINLFVSHKKRVGSYVEWEGSLATDPSNGKYYLVMFNDKNTASSFYYSARVTYIDN